MRILVTGTPRSGTTAYCDMLFRTNIVKQNFGECLNIEDLLLPRNKHTGAIIYKNCSEKFLYCLEKFDWEGAWLNKPKPESDCFYLDCGHNMYYYEKKELPQSIEEFKTQHLVRWDRLKNIDNWCIKYFNYHGVPLDILKDIQHTVDRIDILFRKDKIQQAISGMIAREAGKWGYIEYNNDNPNWFDYKMFERLIEDIIKDENYIKDKFDSTNILYYEDIDLTSSFEKKNKYSIIYDIDRCKEIVKKYDGT